MAGFTIRAPFLASAGIGSISQLTLILFDSLIKAQV